MQISLFVPDHAPASTCPINAQSISERSLITTLKQYTAIITDEYLQKIDNPFRSYSYTLSVHQKLFSLDKPSAICSIFQAIQKASGLRILSAADLDARQKKRKALGERSEEEMNRRQRTQSENGDREIKAEMEVKD
jgi:hypothetical protein